MPAAGASSKASLPKPEKGQTVSLRGGGGSASAIATGKPAGVPGVGLKGVFTKKHNSAASPGASMVAG